MIAGQKYKHKHFKTVYKCVFVGQTLAVFQWDDFDEASIHKSNWDMYEIYYEPVVHKRKIAVFKDRLGRISFSAIRPMDHKFIIHGEILKEIEIEYTEAP